MSPKNFFHILQDQDRSIHERIFRLLTTAGLIVYIAVGIVAFVLGENFVNLLILAGGFCLFFGITIFAVKTRRFRVGADLIAFVILFFVLPFCFFSSDGMKGGTPLWFVFCAVYICFVVYGWERLVFLIGTAVMAVLCYMFAYFFPQMLMHHSEMVSYISSLCSLIAVSALICMLTLFEISVYREEKKLAQKQKKEIEELNLAQQGFFSSMSHEIRTPINTIIGLNEMILREDISDEVADDAKNIQSASKILLQVINDLLDMSKIESGEMEIHPVVYDVGAMLSELVNIIWIRAKEKGLGFHVNVDPSIPTTLYGDDMRIKQILINLLNNAVKYTKEGTITLSVQYKQREDGKKLILYSVEDTGTGIKKENIPYLFDAFKRAEHDKNQYIEGTGLGLSIVKQFTELMGGEISVNSVYLKGSTFVLELPQEVVDGTQIGEVSFTTGHSTFERKEYHPSFEASNARILVVDDNDTNLLVVRKLLRDTKIQIETVSSGAMALQKTLESRYDLVFMDHLMPEMDGIACFHAMKDQIGGLNKETPVIVLTANAGSENELHYSREGFDGYLLKPVSGEELEREIMKFLPEELMEVQSEEGDTIGNENLPTRGYGRKIPVIITTDSVCDLPPELVRQENIPVIPYLVNTDDGIFLDGVETEATSLISYMESGDENTVTACPSEIEDYEIFFSEQLARAQQIIHISMSSKLSTGFETAVEAAQTFDNVTVIDSGSLSSGVGFLALYANSLTREELTVEEMIEKIEQWKVKVDTSFILNDTKYLARSGQIGNRIHMICKGLSLRPAFQMRKGRMRFKGIYIGRMERVWRRYIRSTMHDSEEIDGRRVFVSHVGLSSTDLKEIEDEIRRYADVEEVICQKTSPALASYSGAGSFGVVVQR